MSKLLYWSALIVSINKLPVFKNWIFLTGPEMELIEFLRAIGLRFASFVLSLVHVRYNLEMLSESEMGLVLGREWDRVGAPSEG